jgi:hypothetical protein
MLSEFRSRSRTGLPAERFSPIVAAQFTLGQFFEELAIRLDASCVDEYCAPDIPVVIYVDGQPQSGDPADIVLRDLQEIAIVIGPPPEEIPDTFSGEA